MTTPRIDCLQYANWSEKIFSQMRAGNVHAVHVTIAYHELFQEMVRNIIRWQGYFQRYPEMIFQGRQGACVQRAMRENKTAIFFGFQNPSPIEDDIGLIEVCYDLGARFMQLSYNNQSLLACGCYEATDSGITRFGRQAIREMNRVGLVVDMSHSGDVSTLQAIELSRRPIAITHANPASWHPARRNKSDDILKALTDSGGMLGFSLYPHHLRDGSQCALQTFCRMIADTVARYGIDAFGIGSDLCQDQPDSVVEWMRNGRWSRELDYGEGSADKAGFPPPPAWFQDNRDFDNIAAGLAEVGFSAAEVGALMGGNWHRFYQREFVPQA